MTEDEMKTKVCHKTHRGETTSDTAGTVKSWPALCLGSACMAFRAVGNSCYCADLKRDA